MADYIATIDDSGGIEPLVKWGGIYVPGDHPITCITSLLIRADLTDSFAQQWLELRQNIQRDLGCSYLPPIHMRLMYGRHKPPKYRGKPNPYLGCDFEKVVEWLTRGVQIIESFRREPRGLYWNTIWETREASAQRILDYFSDPNLVKELDFLKAHGKRSARRSFAERYLKKMSSPLLPLLSRQILQLDEFMRQLKEKTVELRLDPFAEASGMDAIEILGAVKRVIALPRISQISVMQDTDEVQLAQAVDLVGYVAFRTIMADQNYIERDLALQKIMQDNAIPRKFVAANVTHIVNRRLDKNPALGTSIHYAVARAAVEKIDSDFAQEHLLTVEEFYSSIAKSDRYKKGHSILKPKTLEAVKNGEDPS